MGAAIAASALVSGAAGAATFTNHTGSVATSWTGADGYTFVGLNTPTGYRAAFYTGTNSAIATVLDNAKRLDQDATVSIDDITSRIIYVQ